MRNETIQITIYKSTINKAKELFLRLEKYKYIQRKRNLTLTQNNSGELKDSNITEKIIKAKRTYKILEQLDSTRKHFH